MCWKTKLTTAVDVFNAAMNSGKTFHDEVLLNHPNLTKEQREEASKAWFQDERWKPLLVEIENSVSIILSVRKQYSNKRKAVKTCDELLNVIYIMYAHICHFRNEENIHLDEIAALNYTPNTRKLDKSLKSK